MLTRPLFLLLALLCAPVAFAQSWPTKPVRLVVSLPPGTPPDQISRGLAPSLGESLGQPVVVENRVGANGVLALEAVARSPADGYTVVYTPGFPLVVGPHLLKMPIDVERDLIPVAPTARVTSFLVVPASFPAKTLAEFVSYVRANPGKLNYGSGGNGSQPHIATAMFARGAKLDVVHVPYKGSTETLTALLGGQIDFTFDVGVALAQVKAGKLRLLAVASSARSALFPDTPTLRDTGIDADSSTLHGVYVPGGTPRAIVERLNRETVRIMQTPPLRGVLAALGADLATGTPEEFAANQRRDRERFGAVIREAGIKAD
jgi:tripartite-type tricarboxylate transporter receptor subunit TctC